MESHNKKDDEGMALFKQALNEALARKFEKEIAQCDEPIEFSDNHKRWANDFFRETVGSSYVPHPEIETAADKPEEGRT